MNRMLRLWMVIPVLAAAWLLAPAGIAAQEAKPLSQRELLAEMNRAEKRFIDLYNQLNSDARHEMACESQEVTGSRLRKGRTCRTSGQASVAADAARGYLQGLELSSAVDNETVAGRQLAATNREFGGPLERQTSAPSAGAEYSGKALSDAGSRLQEERVAFERHMTTLLAKHPELQQRLDEFIAARSRHAAARRL